jgi:hypothetical protein
VLCYPYACSSAHPETDLLVHLVAHYYSYDVWILSHVFSSHSCTVFDLISTTRAYWPGLLRKRLVAARLRNFKVIVLICAVNTCSARCVTFHSCSSANTLRHTEGGFGAQQGDLGLRPCSCCAHMQTAMFSMIIALGSCSARVAEPSLGRC